MSWHIEIFVDCPCSLDAFAKEVSSTLGIKLEPLFEDTGVAYDYSGTDFYLKLYGDHGMVNDRDMNFEDYPYVISLSRLNIFDRENAQTNTLDFAWLAFEKLKRTGRCSLMLVENVQKILALFSPDNTGQ
jgi:hypothetical protein